MSQQVSRAEIKAMWELADQRSGRAGMVQCPGCPEGYLVPDTPETEGYCSRHREPIGRLDGIGPIGDDHYP